MSKFLPLKKYLQISKYMITQYGNNRMLKDNEAIGFVANWLMKADDKYDSSLDRPNGTRYGYRFSYGKWAILKWISEEKNKISKNKEIYIVPEEIDGIIGEENCESSVDNNEIIDKIHQCRSISKQQRECIIKYFIYGYTYKEVGKELDISFSWARKQTQKGLKKLRIYLNEMV